MRLYADYEVKQPTLYGDSLSAIAYDHMVMRVTLGQEVILNSVFSYFTSKNDSNAALHVFNLFRVSDGVRLYSENLWLTEVVGWKEYQLTTPPILQANVEYAVGFYVPPAYQTNLPRDTTATASVGAGISTPSGITSSWMRQAYYLSVDNNGGTVMPTAALGDTLGIKLGVSLNALPNAPTNVSAANVVEANPVPVSWTHNDPDSDPQVKYQIKYRRTN